MKVNIDGKVYFVHFETRSHRAKTDDKDLFDVSCKIRDENKQTVSEAEVKQNYHDKCDMVYARKLAFTRALDASAVKDKPDCSPWIEFFNKSQRSIFWKEFKDKCRYKV
jgi:hypothetical protein